MTNLGTRNETSSLEDSTEMTSKIDANGFAEESTKVSGNDSSGSKSPQSSGYDKRDPDPDSIKMFVGQIPRHWTETECRSFFQEFGEIHSVNVLRDKKSGLSRGCCFVTYYRRQSALDAQNALHNVRVLPGMHHPLQVKPADSENRNERKLFVGMLSKKFTESEVRQMFSVYGNIEECTILKDSAGQSKGCAFVTFSSRTSAINAIKAMNHSVTLEGCTSPLVVKFADSQKEKEARKQQQMLVQQLWAAVASPTLATTVSNPYLAFAAAAAATAAQQQQQQQFAAAAATLALQQQLIPFANQDPFALSTLTSNPMLAAALRTTPQSPASPTIPAAAMLANTASLYGTSQGSFSSRASNSSSSPLTTTASGNASQASKSTSNSSSSMASKQLEGPDGANLFIYHLPAEYTDDDLVQAFASFGNVISSKVFIDKQTNLSKCFGFVSFDNPVSAQAAIQAMNGFQIGNKRLKVQLKKTREKPY